MFCRKYCVWFLLGVSHLINTELHNPENKNIQTVLNKREYPCTSLQALVFGSAIQEGIRRINLHIEQEIVIVSEIMRTLRTPGYGQDFLPTSIRIFQHASGLSQPLLEYPDQQAPHLKGHYCVYLQMFLVEHKM